MLMRVSGSVVFLSILLCVLAAETSEGRRRPRFFDDVGDSYSLMAPALTKKGNIKKSMRVLPPQLRATLVECLRRHDLLEKSSNTLMITPSSSPHHNMAHRESKQVRHASAPSPARNIVPRNSPSPSTKSSHSPRPAPSQDLDFDAPLPEVESFTPLASTPMKPQPKEGNTAGSLNQAPAHPSRMVGKRVIMNFENFAGSSQRSLSFDSSSNKEISSTSGRVSSIKHISVVSENPKSPRQAAITSETGVPAPQQGALKLPPGKPAPPPPPPKPRPPPPPKGGRPPPAPAPKIGTHARGNSAMTDGYDSNGDSEAPKAKLKPFFLG